MSRFTPDQLRDKALHALEELHDQALKYPLEPTAAARFAFAYLANTVDDRSSFDKFWKAVTSSCPDVNPTMVQGLRSSHLRGGILGIYEALGMRREG